METKIIVKNEYNSLDTLLEFLKKETSFECFKDYDQWDVRTNANGQMEKCLVIKKSAMHGAKLFFEKENTVHVSYIIPNKLMHAYFGNSVKAHKNILEIIAGIIKGLILAIPQQKAFEELTIITQKAAK